MTHVGIACETAVKVAVIVVGYVGKAMVELLSPFADVVTYDKARDEDRYPFDLIASCDFAVICVDTPENTMAAVTRAGSGRRSPGSPWTGSCLNQLCRPARRIGWLRKPGSRYASHPNTYVKQNITAASGIVVWRMSRLPSWAASRTSGIG